MLTGATGFIGRHLADGLAAAGHQVRCLARKPGSVETSSSVRFHHADFSRPDLGVKDDVFDDVEMVYHLAGATRAATKAGFHEANVGITERLLDRITGLDRSPRLVYISSQAAAGPSRSEAHVIDETDQPAPIEEYGRSKLAAELAVLSRRGVLPVTIVRPVAVYGPGDRDFLSIFRLARRHLAVFPGIRDSVINTIFVGDLVGGLIAAGKSGAAIGNTYFMGHRSSASWKAIYQAVADALGVGAVREINIPLPLIRLGGSAGDVVGRITGRPPLLNGNKAALAEPRFWLCSSERAATDLGFVAPTSLHDGLRATYDWYVRHRWL